MSEKYYYYLLLVQYLFAFAITVQSIEYLKIRQTLLSDGIWRSSYFPDIVINLILVVRLLMSLSLFYSLNWINLAVLLGINIWIGFTFLKSFNGGSDSMTMVVLLGLLLEFIYPMAGLFYIAVQSLLSYFISGVIKIKSEKWRSGVALFAYQKLSPYPKMAFFKNLNRSSLLSWVVIVFEIMIPFAAFTEFVKYFLVMGLGFHLVVNRIYGLNRFLHIWLATYPAILFLSQSGILQFF